LGLLARLGQGHRKSHTSSLINERRASKPCWNKARPSQPTHDELRRGLPCCDYRSGRLLFEWPSSEKSQSRASHFIHRRTGQPIGLPPGGPEHLDPAERRGLDTVAESSRATRASARSSRAVLHPPAGSVNTRGPITISSAPGLIGRPDFDDAAKVMAFAGRSPGKGCLFVWPHEDSRPGVSITRKSRTRKLILPIHFARNEGGREEPDGPPKKKARPALQAPAVPGGRPERLPSPPPHRAAWSCCFLKQSYVPYCPLA